VGLEASSTKLLPVRTTVVAITGATLGQVSLLEIDACANQSVVGIRPSPTFPGEYIYFWVKESIRLLVERQTGAAQQHINRSDVGGLDLLVPPPAILGAYSAAVKPAFDRIAELAFESETQAELRDVLLHHLLCERVPA
jgi:type I restriction enzyme, S subunit